MKKIILLLTLLVFLVKSFSQTPALTKDEYLQKSKNQKTTAWVLLVGGSALIITGILVDDANSGKGINLDFTGVGIAAVGFVAASCSIPLFINSAHNARKAATISFNNQKILFPQQHTVVLKTQPTLTLKIAL
jgi:hypothetical protein